MWPTAYTYILIYLRSAHWKPEINLGIGCLGRWRGAKFNIGLASETILFPMWAHICWSLNIVMGCDINRKTSMCFTIWWLFLAAQGPKEASKTMKIHSTKSNWSSRSRRGQKPPHRSFDLKSFKTWESCGPEANSKYTNIFLDSCAIKSEPWVNQTWKEWI